MRVTIKYNNIEHSVDLSDDTSRGALQCVCDRLMMCCGYNFDEDRESEIITESNFILGVKDDH